MEKTALQEFQSLIGRLQTLAAILPTLALLPFQSLIGRLQTVSMSTPLFATPAFQSLIGRLQTWGWRRISWRNCSFNPS